jgi:hypothetical protein
LVHHITGRVYLTRAEQRTALGNITICIHKSINNFVNFIENPQLTNVAGGRMVEHGGPRFGYPCDR